MNLINLAKSHLQKEQRQKWDGLFNFFKCEVCLYQVWVTNIVFNNILLFSSDAGWVYLMLFG